MSNLEDSRLTLDFIHKLAIDLCFEIDDEQCRNLLLEFDAIQKYFKSVVKIDTAAVTPLSYPFDLIKKGYMRADDEEIFLPTKKVLACAPSVYQNYITINRVISDEN